MPHIVIAEDDPAMRQFLAVALTRAGHQVASFPDGATAHTYLVDLDRPVDLLLTDIVMPGMDGIELSTRVRGLRPLLPVLYITGFGVTVPERLAVNGRAAQILAKPLHLNNLLAEVTRHLAQSSTGYPQK